MRALLLTVAVSTLPLVGGSTAHRASPQVLVPNPNTTPAGAVRDGVLTIDLDATNARWHREGGAPSVKVVDAFAEPGRAPTIPGPLVRIPAGTELRFRVRNRLARSITYLSDSAVVRWRPLAKDGADLPEQARVPRAARQIISMGETYDFEYTPTRPGVLRIEVRAPALQGALLVRVPVKVQ